MEKKIVFVGKPPAADVVMTRQCGDDVMVIIDSVPGKRQYLQFGATGTMRINVVAARGKSTVERRTVDVEVVRRPNSCDGCSRE